MNSINSHKNYVQQQKCNSELTKDYMQKDYKKVLAVFDSFNLIN